MDLITSSASLWGPYYAGCSLGHPDDTTRVSQNSNPHMPLPGMPYIAGSAHPGSLPTQNFDRYRTDAQLNGVPQQLTHSHALLSELSVAPSGYQLGSSTPLEDTLMYSDEGRRFESQWWSTPSMDQWDYPTSANEVYGRDTTT